MKRCPRLAAGVFRRAAIAASLVAGGLDLWGQVSPDLEEVEPVIALQEFTVSAERLSAYRTSTSITASGIGTRMADLPIAFSTVTSEFMRDTAAMELREALSHVPGVLGNPRAESAFTIRGFAGLAVYRNGQYRRQLFPTWNLDRIEVAKGAAGIFFGAVRPGGVINYLTAKPVLGQRATTAELTAGSDSFFQAAIFHNEPLGDSAALRVGAGRIDADGQRRLEYKRETYLGGSFLWQPRENQRLTIDLETVRRNQFYLNAYGGRALSNSRYLFNPAVPPADPTTISADADLRAWLDANGFAGVPTFDIFAPIYGPDDSSGATIPLAADARSSLEARTIDAEYLIRLTDRVVWQTNLNYAYDRAAGLQPSGGDTRPYADGSLRFRVEDWINLRDSYNVDNRLTWRFDARGAVHTLQLGQEYWRIVYERPGYLDAQNRFNASPFGAFTYHYRPGVDDPVSLRALMLAGGQSFNVSRRQEEESQGWFAVAQSQFWRGNIRTLMGARYNRYSATIRYSRPVANSNLSAGAPGGLADRDAVGAGDGWTPQFGALVRIAPGVAAFASYSESIEPDYQIDADGASSEAVESRSYDLGTKLEAYDGRLAGTISFYSTDRRHLKFRDTAREIATGRAPYFIYGNAEHSEGLEVDMNAAVTDNWQLVFGWHHFFAADTTRSNQPERVGIRLPYTPEDTLTLWTRYTIGSGAWRGFSLGSGLRHHAAARISNDPNNVVANPAFTVCDLMLAYRFPQETAATSIQLNVKNVFDRLYREGPDGFFNTRRQILLSVRREF